MKVEAEPTIVEEGAAKMTELEEKVTLMKERGNLHFKKKSYKEAIKSFSEGINFFEAASKPMQSKDLKVKVT